MNPVIMVTGVGKRYSRYHPHRPTTIQGMIAKRLKDLRTLEVFWGLRDVTFSVGAGRTVGIVGANGSGKSTLLRLIAGVGRPDTGRIEVRGRIGGLLDLGAGFHPDLTGRENALLSGILNGLTRKQALNRLESIVAFAEVEEVLDNPIRTFSSGMLMRLAFAVAVHTEPEVLLIDEVLSVGDMSFERKCMRRIDEFKAAGCSILIVSHSAATIEALCDDALWLESGRVAAHGRTDEVVQRYTAYMGGDPATPEAAPVLR
jgi:lipopolysaccharide transport system ATP-binding protein